MKIKPGMRTIKTAVAVGLSVAISYALKLEYPFYAAIACVVVLQIYSKDTVTAGRNRLLGTLAGGLAGSLFAYMPIDKSIASFFGIIFLFFILSQFRLNKSMTIGGIVFMRIMVDLDYSKEAPLLFTYNRLLATLLGVVIAVAVNLLLFPYHRTKEIDKRFILLKARLFDSLTDLLAYHTLADIPALKKDCDTLQGHLEKNTAEYKLFARRDEQVAEMRKAVEMFQSILRHMVMIQELPEKCRQLDEQNSRALSVLTACRLPETTGESEEYAKNIVYNYHASCMLDCAKEIENALAQPPQLWTSRAE
ncbi:MAG: aromatic acid exporter family protein [Ethanoligenens sp.]